VTGATGYVGGRLVPRLLGLLYWRERLFSGMIARIVAEAEARGKKRGE
jgi:uncharacterized protein YbjT (DUF2867 family)